MANLFEPDAVEAAADHLDEVLRESVSQIGTFLVGVPIPISEVAGISPQ